MAVENAAFYLKAQLFLSTVFIFGFFGIIVMDSHTGFELDDYMSGILSAGVPLILQFWFTRVPQSKDQ